jgi:hypothetical protein
MKFLCGDTYLGTKTELRSVGEGSGGIVIDTSCVHFAKETLGG